MMRKISADRNLAKDVTNHSLRSYGVTKMFAANVPEKMIMECGGHHSVEGVRQYERINALQEIQVCKILNSNPSQATVTPSLPQTSVTQLRPPQLVPPLAFQGCTFSNCTFQVYSTPQQPFDHKELSDINNKDFLNF